MTQQRTFKRRVRARMAKTGESYTAARRMLLSEPAFKPPAGSERVVEMTGRPWEDWFALLDESGAGERSHAEIARWLRDEQGVASWWNQAITVAYEQARGLREPGENANGFSASASKTVAVPVERLYTAFMAAAGDMRPRTATEPRSARFDWKDGATRVNVGFTAAGEAKSRVALAHERLPDAAEAAAMKAMWRERLQALKAELEDGGR